MPSPAIRRKVTRSDAQHKPHLSWNAYVDLLAMSKYEDLAPTQRTAALAFWYDSEVQNGGHLQFFENTSGRRVPETLDALPALGAHRQRDILSDAYRRRRSKPRLRIRTVLEFVKAGREREYEDLDFAYNDAVPTITTLLEAWLAQHFDDFIELVDQ